MTTTSEPSYGPEVARLMLPMAVRGMDKLVTYLEGSYGKGLMMHQDGDWMVFNQPKETAGG